MEDDFALFDPLQPAPAPGPAPAPEKINGAAKLFGAAVNGIEKDKNDNKIEQPRKSGAAEVKPLPAEATAKLEAGGEQAGPQQPKRPSYRVLEDPDLEVAPPSRPGISSPRHRHETSLRRSFVKITGKTNLPTVILCLFVTVTEMSRIVLY